MELTARSAGARVGASGCRRALAAAAAQLGLAGAHVSVLLTDDAEMAAINGRMRHRPRPTDVLSFPAGDDLPAGELPGRGHLGDVVVSVETAARQAAATRKPLEREVHLLLLHGLLHLCGYDHENDGGEMMRLQARLARDILPAPGQRGRKGSGPRSGPGSTRKQAPRRSRTTR